MTVAFMRRQVLGVHPLTGLDCWWVQSPWTGEWVIVP